jgi:hypothetical protein
MIAKTHIATCRATATVVSPLLSWPILPIVFGSDLSRKIGENL